MLPTARTPTYAGYWPHLRRVLRPYGILAVDNAVSRRDQVAAFRELLGSAAEFAVDLDEVGDGVLTGVRVR